MADLMLVPQEGSGPGVLLLHAWWGRTAFFEQLARRLADEGFAVSAPDLYADGRTAGTIEEAEALMRSGRPTSEEKGEIVRRALDELRAHPGVRGARLGVVGFSMGAAWAISASTWRPDDLAAVVLFYGVGDGDFAASRSAYLGHFGDADDWEPLDGVRAMETELREAGRDVELHVYPGARHWFFESDRPEFDPAAAELAWARTVDFLKARLAPGTEVGTS